MLLSATKASKRVADSVKIMSFFAPGHHGDQGHAAVRGIPPTEKARNLIASGLNETDKRNMAMADYISKRVSKAADVLPAPAPPPQGPTRSGTCSSQSNLAVAFGKKSIKAQLGEFFDQAAGVLVG
ncbi:hypothetical protein LV779_36640 [Streptomyces thinghirensis]|nr:hypothetical protein [Streptomyces thinghirensis]